MALKYYSDVEELEKDIPAGEALKISNSKHLGITKKDVKNWIKYIMDEKPIVEESLATRILKSGRAKCSDKKNCFDAVTSWLFCKQYFARD